MIADRSDVLGENLNWRLKECLSYQDRCIYIRRYILSLFLKLTTLAVGEMAQPLRALATIPEEPGLIPSTDKVYHRDLYLQLHVFSSGLCWHQAYKSAQTYMQVKYSWSWWPMPLIQAFWRKDRQIFGSSKPASLTKRVVFQSELHSETLSQQTKARTENRRTKNQHAIVRHGM